MLVLSGKKGDRFHLGDDIVITILSLRQGQSQARLGFDAPEAIKIKRGKHYDAEHVVTNEPAIADQLPGDRRESES